MLGLWKCIWFSLKQIGFEELQHMWMIVNKCYMFLNNINDINPIKMYPFWLYGYMICWVCCFSAQWIRSAHQHRANSFDYGPLCLVRQSLPPYADKHPIIYNMPCIPIICLDSIVFLKVWKIQSQSRQFRPQWCFQQCGMFFKRSRSLCEWLITFSTTGRFFSCINPLMHPKIMIVCGRVIREGSLRVIV